jgi:hypothetical protein
MQAWCIQHHGGFYFVSQSKNHIYIISLSPFLCVVYQQNLYLCPRSVIVVWCVWHAYTHTHTHTHPLSLCASARGLHPCPNRHLDSFILQFLCQLPRPALSFPLSSPKVTNLNLGTFLSQVSPKSVRLLSFHMALVWWLALCCPIPSWFLWSPLGTSLVGTWHSHQLSLSSLLPVYILCSTQLALSRHWRRSWDCMWVTLAVWLGHIVFPWISSTCDSTFFHSKTCQKTPILLCLWHLYLLTQMVSSLFTPKLHHFTRMCSCWPFEVHFPEHGTHPFPIFKSLFLL